MANYLLGKLKTVILFNDTLNSFQIFVTYFNELHLINQFPSSSTKILKQVKNRKRFIGLYMLLFVVFFFIQTSIPPTVNVILFNFVFIENLEPYWNICWISIIFISWYSIDMLYSDVNGATTVLLHQILIQERNDFFIWPYHKFNGKTIASHVICKAVEARNLFRVLSVANGITHLKLKHCFNFNLFIDSVLLRLYSNKNYFSILFSTDTP